LIGTTTLNDSLLCSKQGGIVCMTGIVGNQWSMREFAPMEAIPTAVYLTSLRGRHAGFHAHTAEPTGKTSRGWNAQNPNRQDIPFGQNCGSTLSDGGKHRWRQDRRVNVSLLQRVCIASDLALG
jgi:hypothetical protein